MKEYIIEDNYVIKNSTDSKGSQTKWYKDGYWYKQDNVGKEGEAEALCSLLLKCSDAEDYVTYESCIVNGKKGCRSRHFLKKEEQFITFQRLYENYERGKI